MLQTSNGYASGNEEIPLTASDSGRKSDYFVSKKHSKERVFHKNFMTKVRRSSNIPARAQAGAAPLTVKQ
jgi:hypothetical protein